MDFVISIDYNVKSTVSLSKDIKYEYYQNNKGKIFYDTVTFSNKKIKISGSRDGTIDIENCWRSKKSNYKRCIISSLFYTYNFYKEPIKDIKISIQVKEKTLPIPFINEFNHYLETTLKMDDRLIQKLFKSVTYEKLSNMIYSLLYNQVLFVKDNDFYFSYRMFNAIYTYIYQDRKNNSDRKPDKEAIVDVLKSVKAAQVQNSIDLANNFWDTQNQEIHKLIYTWLIEENVKQNSFSAKIGYSDFHYSHIKILMIIHDILKKRYDIDCNKNHKLPEGFKGFKKKLNEASSDDPLNYIQLIALYANYRRNKILHGEQVDSSLFIPDINSDILKEISEIICQLSIDLVNSLELQ